ncbi:riboflavin biosynthesis protein RibD-like [Hibiscus syriacus]|uniref:Riboflavin biosynthesis protein RibD-like n=1 Tax=Hibiscus syriacus TaxID=106335 RepID=A0A6A2Y981_HIBSY|nr:seipin-1 [Hibiscus syriacus]KAE8673716.1 riboflavin biosynthesis protein RibD-like [Hibiscus syriacus]
MQKQLYKRLGHTNPKHKFTLIIASSQSLSPPEMEDKEPQAQANHAVPKPADSLTTLLSLQADILYNCFIALSSPFFTFSSAALDSYHRAEDTAASVETAVQRLPSNITHGSSVLLKRVGLGLLGAAKVCMLLVFLMVLAALVGIGLVQIWVEEPVFLRQKLFFDYTQVNPTAVFRSGGGGFDDGSNYRKKQMTVPIGHTIHVHLVLLMPESDFNINIGVFQLSAELLSINGDIMAKSSQPVMLRFTSLPVRLARTFLMGIPFLLGISNEAQKVKTEILRYKEGYPRSEAIRVTLSPRAGTLSLPQLYEAEIIMNSQLPWPKQLVHNWKWTLYAWTSLYVYTLFLIVLVGCCFRPLFFPFITSGFGNGHERDTRLRVEEAREPAIGGRSDQSEVSDIIRKWQQSRRKRKADFLNIGLSDVAGSSASSMSLTRDDKSAVIEEDVGDSESVCLGG